MAGAKTNKKQELTDKQEKFCRAYVKLTNITAAYKQAYNTSNMKPDTINRKASFEFAKGKIRARIMQLQTKLAQKDIVTVENVVLSLFDFMKEGRNDRVQAADKLMKHLGAYDAHNRQKVVDDKIDVSSLSDEELTLYLSLQAKARAKSKNDE